jgi:two-component sensor histidine kinase
LAALCAAFILPILGFVGLLLWQTTGAERQRLEQQGTEILRKVAAAVDRDLAVQGAVTELAAHSPALLSGDLTAVDRALGELARALDMRIMLRSTTGQDLLGTGAASRPITGQGAREEDGVVLKTRRPVASNLFADPSTPLVAITAPVVRPSTGEVVSLLSFAFPPGRIAQAVAREGASPGALAFVLDGNGRVVGASRPTLAATGREWSGLAALRSGPRRFEMEAPDGTRLAAQSMRLAGANWTVVVGLEEEALRAPVQRFLLQLGGIGLALSLLSAALALSFGRRITNAIDQLREAAASVGLGGAMTPVSTPVVEINEVGQALEAAGAAVKHSQDRQALLNRELHHRVKNNLATVQAVVGSAARSAGSLDAFRDALSSRLASLGKTHDLLVDRGWAGASLEAILRNELQPYDEAGTARVALSGPPIELAPDTVLALGMLAHELATNAAKYGALSVPTGCLQVAWSIEMRGDERWMRLEWVETRGPAVEPPARQGFGSKLLERISGQLGGTVSRVFAPGGLRLDLRVPLPTLGT